jgi:hypothetical protein
MPRRCARSSKGARTSRRRARISTRTGASSTGAWSEIGVPIRIVAMLGEIPLDLVAARTSVTEDVRQTLWKALVNMATDAELGAIVEYSVAANSSAGRPRATRRFAIGSSVRSTRPSVGGERCVGRRPRRLPRAKRDGHSLAVAEPSNVCARFTSALTAARQAGVPTWTSALSFPYCRWACSSCCCTKGSRRPRQ